MGKTLNCVSKKSSLLGIILLYYFYKIKKDIFFKKHKMSFINFGQITIVETIINITNYKNY